MQLLMKLMSEPYLLRIHYPLYNKLQYIIIIDHQYNKLSVHPNTNTQNELGTNNS